MRVQLINTKYGGIIRQLEGYQLYCSGNNFAEGRWYSDLGEAYQDTLIHYRNVLARYKRDCDGKRSARDTIQLLEQTHGPQKWGNT